MRVRVLYFAALRDLVGVGTEDVELPGEVADVAAFVAWAARARPVLAGRLGAVRVARNERFAGAGEALAEGDELALLPPLAGG